MKFFWYIFASRSEIIPCWKIKSRLIDDLGKLKHSSRSSTFKRKSKQWSASGNLWHDDAFRSAGERCSCNCTEFVWFQVIVESISNFSELASLFIVSMNLYFCELALYSLKRAECERTCYFILMTKWVGHFPAKLYFKLCWTTNQFVWTYE